MIIKVVITSVMPWKKYIGEHTQTIDNIVSTP